jgi:hypothetical protein
MKIRMLPPPRLGFSIFAALIFTLGLSACGGSDPATAERQTQHARVRASIAEPVENEPVTQQLYIAYFGRPADANGLNQFKYQLYQLGVGPTAQDLNASYATNAGLRALVNSFGDSPESNALYTGDTAAFVQAIYVNLLNRAPDAEGKAYWVHAIDSGLLTRAKAALSILAAAQVNPTPQGLIDAQLIANKSANSKVFTSLAPVDAYRGEFAAQLAREMLRKVTAATTVEEFRATIDSTIVKLTTAELFTYTGNYTGSYDGSDEGTFSFTVAPDGTISGSGKSNLQGVTLIITGSLANASGPSVPVAGSIGPLSFTATLTTDGKLNGSWNGLGMSGSLRATRIIY